MALCEQNCTAYIVKFWENFVSNMVDMLGDYSITDEKVRVTSSLPPSLFLPLSRPASFLSVLLSLPPSLLCLTSLLLLPPFSAS